MKKHSIAIILVIIFLLIAGCNINPNEADATATPVNITNAPIVDSQSVDEPSVIDTLPVMLEPIEESPNVLPSAPPEMDILYTPKHIPSLPKSGDLNDILTTLLIEPEILEVVSPQETRQNTQLNWGENRKNSSISGERYEIYYEGNDIEIISPLFIEYLETMPEEYTNIGMVLKFSLDYPRNVFVFNMHCAKMENGEMTDTDQGVELWVGENKQADFKIAQDNMDNIESVFMSYPTNYLMQHGPWFYVLMTVDKDANMLFVFWQEDNPRNYIYYKTNLEDNEWQTDYTDCEWGYKLFSPWGGEVLCFNIGESYIIDYKGIAE